MSADRHAVLIGINEYPYVETAPDLRGCINDLITIYDLLTGPFRFPVKNVQSLGNEEATQAGIRAAFQNLLEPERVGEDDVVVCFYSGHGSWMELPEGRSETIVPYDSGREPNPNRDIRDQEIDRWVQRLNEKTPYVTLIFDCCFSGSVTRDPWGQPTRLIEGDRRAPEEMFEDGHVPASPQGNGQRGRGFRFVPGRRQAVMVAACRADEWANEVVVPERGGSFAYGALTYQLSQALARTRDNATWRDVFEQVGPAVTDKYERQHPQIEGDWDEELFGTQAFRPQPYLTVRAANARGVELAGGAAHGVTSGSVWSIHPAETRHAGDDKGLASVRIESVAATSCEARILKPEDRKKLARGQRAFLRVQRVRAPGLKVLLAGEAASDGKLRGLIEKSPLLKITTRRPADVLVRRLEPRVEVTAGDPCPNLGPLKKPTWAAVGDDGRLAVGQRTANARETELLVRDLESLERYRQVVKIENLHPESALRGGVDLEVQRWSDKRQKLVTAKASQEDDGLISLKEKEWLDFVIRNDLEHDVWITLLLFDCDRSITRLVPRPGHPKSTPRSHPLKAEETLSIVDYMNGHPQNDYGHQWLDLPQGFPWAAEPGENRRSGLVRLKLMVTPGETNFNFLEQPRLLPARNPRAHPLVKLARLYHVGKGSRDFKLRSVEESPELDWATVTRAIQVRRT